MKPINGTRTMTAMPHCANQENQNACIRPPFDSDRLTRPEAAEYLGLEASTLATDVSTKKLGIPYVKVGSRVYYRRSQLNEWLEIHHVIPSKVIS